TVDHEFAIRMIGDERNGILARFDGEALHIVLLLLPFPIHGAHDRFWMPFHDRNGIFGKMGSKYERIKMIGPVAHDRQDLVITAEPSEIPAVAGIVHALDRFIEPYRDRAQSASTSFLLGDLAHHVSREHVA